MKTIFVGAVDGSRAALSALINAGLPPMLVVTLPTVKASRHSDFADLATLAEASGIQVHLTVDINHEATLLTLRECDPDLILVIGWSQICQDAFRKIPRLGSIGFHPAALPKYRGRAVIPWTILLDEKESGSSFFWLDAGTDSGPLVLQKVFPVSARETAASLYRKQIENLESMTPEVVRLVRSGNPPRIEQDHGQAIYCAKRTPEDGLIDWAQPAEFVERFVRAVGAPYPGAFCFYDENHLHIDKAEIFPDSGRFVGLTGQVQTHTSRGFVVRCGDGRCVEVTSWRGIGDRKPALHKKLYGSQRCVMN